MSKVSESIEQAGVLPEVGSTWAWEPLRPHASQTVVVTEVKWNGEEWFVESDADGLDGRHWNNLSRWVEATVLVAPVEP